jgi:subtilisin family serine protease
MKAIKLKKYLTILSIVAFFTGCGGGGGGFDVTTDGAQNVVTFTEAGVSGSLAFSLNDLNERSYEITDISVNGCENEPIAPIAFTLNEEVPERTIDFKVDFTRPCYTDGITVHYNVTTTFTRVDGSTYEKKESFSKTVFNPAYDQNKVYEATGDDPLFQYQWHLKNTGQDTGVITPATPGEDINVTPVWDERITGKSVTVAVIDEGVDIFHPDLKDNVSTSLSYNYHTGTGNTSPAINSYAHGTAVAGLIAAKGWNGIGTRGVAPDAKIASFNALEVYDEEVSEEGYSGAALQLVRLCDALTRNLGSIDIYNNSWGNPEITLDYSDYPDFDNQLKYGLIHGRNGKGAIYVKSAGNKREGCGLAEPCDNANFEQIQTNGYFIVAGAVNANGTVSSYSTPGSNILVSAPGGEAQASYLNVDGQMIVTTDLPGDGRGYDIKDDFATNVPHFDVSGNENYDYTQRMNGTSSAAPIVSGVIALMLEANPNLTYRDVRIILARTARQNDPHNPRWKTNAAGLHFHNDYGFGVVDAKRAVDMAKTFTSVGGYFDQNTTSAIGSGAAASNGYFESIATIDRNLTVENVFVSFDLNDTIQYYETYSYLNRDGNFTTPRMTLYSGKNIIRITNRDTDGVIKSFTLKDENDIEIDTIAQDFSETYVDIKKSGTYSFFVDSNSSDWDMIIESPKPFIKASNLEMVLVSPGGTESVLVHAPNALPDGQRYIDENLRFYSTQFMDEGSEGNWTLKLREIEGGTFTIENWNLTIQGHSAP